MLEGFGRYNNLEGSRRHVVLWLPEHFNCSTNAQLSTVTVSFNGGPTCEFGHVERKRGRRLAECRILKRTGLAGTDLMSAVCDLSS